jgi:soluble lytic murein transglycosylase-like protein
LLTHAEVGELIENVAEKHNLPSAFIRSIVAAESAFRSDAVSSKGALGLMQVMPETASEMGLDASIPEQNVEAGTKYLKGLIGYYGKRRDWLKRTIAAYNAGPGNVDKYRGVPPFRETRAYVTRVLSNFEKYRRVTGESAHFGLLARQ